MDVEAPLAPVVDLPTAPSGARVVPIGSLNPYKQRWSIRARVTTKGERREWSNSRGKGSLFSVSLLRLSWQLRQLDASLLELLECLCFSSVALACPSGRHQ